MRAVEPGEQHDLGARLNAPKPCRYVRLEYQPCLGRAFVRLSRGGRDVLQLRFDSPDRFDMDTHLLPQGDGDWGLDREVTTAEEFFSALIASRPSP